ncbi:MAG: LacI family DNA-binding transcriptional regulator [Armatimonadota bacterium]
MRVTIKQIAEKAGVSPSTVSRVLSGRGAHLIAPATRERVLETAQKLEYLPNFAARSLVTGRTYTIALWLKEVYTSFHAWVVQLVEDALWQGGYETLTRCVGRSRTSSNVHLGHVDGILAYECPAYLDNAWRALQRRSAPVVSVGAYFRTYTDYVGVDLYNGGLQAVRHLFQEGCRRVAYLVNAESSHVGDARRDAYDAAMREAGLPVEYIIAPDQSRAASSQTVCEYVQTYGLPDGIFCHNDEMAIGTYHGLRQLGVRVPDDVAIVGCDGIEDTEYLEIPLSTVRQPLEQMCRLACEFLFARVVEPDREKQGIVLQPELVIRGSSRR